MKLLQSKKNPNVMILQNSRFMVPANDSPEFLTAICHELKTPLNAISGFADAMQDELNDPNFAKNAVSYVKEIREAAADLNDLIHDLLDVGQVASGDFSVNLSHEIDICDVIKRSMRINHDYALKRNVLLKSEIDNVRPINLDAKRMKQVLTNLISNAVKYSSAHTEVKISAKTAGEFLEISVIDQGFGMTEDQVRDVFKKFHTCQNPNSGKVDSFGLGLSITKRLIELQNGQIEVRSQINKGTEIHLKFRYSN